MTNSFVNAPGEITRRLTDYIAAASWTDLPAPVRRETLRSFVNIMGCTLGGARHAVVDLADRALREFAGSPHATLIGRGAKAGGERLFVIFSEVPLIGRIVRSYAVHYGDPQCRSTAKASERVRGFFQRWSIKFSPEYYEAREQGPGAQRPAGPQGQLRRSPPRSRVGSAAGIVAAARATSPRIPSIWPRISIARPF